MKTSKKFTLIEILVVITIIAILMALVMPGMKSGIDQSEKTTASVNMTQIAMGIEQFYMEYDYYPANIDDIEINSTANTRKIQFAGATSTRETAWGDQFEFAVDTDEDGLVDSTEGLETGAISTSGANAVAASVVLWADDPDGGYIKSWTRTNEVTK